MKNGTFYKQIILKSLQSIYSSDLIWCFLFIALSVHNLICLLNEHRYWIGVYFSASLVMNIGLAFFFYVKYRTERKINKIDSDRKMKLELSPYDVSIISGYLYSSLYIYRLSEHPLNQNLEVASLNLIKEFNSKLDKEMREDILIKYEIEKALGNVL